MNVLLISTYELGRQPFGLASPAAWLRREGANVRCLDLGVGRLDATAVEAADLVAFHVPMHTATRVAVRALARVRELNPRAHLCFYGLYAPMNEAYLRGLGVETILGGEFEAGLVALVRRQRGSRSEGAPDLQPEPTVSIARQDFLTPDRAGLPPLEQYARLDVGDGRLRTVGYTEASRGCKHLCRHCPIPPVYDGRFRVVQREVVLEDVRRQVAAGAEHVTFGDPDFFNGVRHAREIVTALHREFPDLTYDATIKIEHLLRHARELPLLKETGCLFVTSAVESLDDRVLALLDKGHTRADFLLALDLCRAAGLVLQPTFVAFTPWTTPESHLELLETLDELDLVEHVAPIQLAMRLLIPAGSLLLELAEVRELTGPFDAERLVHPWRHPDPAVDQLQAVSERIAREATVRQEPRPVVFERLRAIARETAGVEATVASSAGAVMAGALAGVSDAPARPAIPYLTEPWYC